MTAYAYAACGVILLGCIVYAADVLAGHERPGCLLRIAGIRALVACTLVLILAVRVRTAILRARWAWRCRRHPALPGHKTIREPERS